MTCAIEVENLAKIYRAPFSRRRVEAVRGVTLTIEAGEVFGFLGPNGAGKTSTIRMLMGLIRPSSGLARIFGHRIPSREARARVGFLPESPYFYTYLTVAELLDLTGRLFGQGRSERRKRANELIELVGLSHARSTALRKYSKGMLQRAGIAQALMNDPDLVVFDEPMSGLDPVGRRDVRDIIYRLRDAKKTVFFSSHILADVESVSDRVAIVVRGQVKELGSVAELVGKERVGTELVLHVGAGEAARIASELSALGTTRHVEGTITATLPATGDVDAFLVRARELGARVHAVTPKHQTLEDRFIALARGADSHPGNRERHEVSIEAQP